MAVFLWLNTGVIAGFNSIYVLPIENPLIGTNEISTMHEERTGTREARFRFLSLLKIAIKRAGYTIFAQETGKQV